MSDELSKIFQIYENKIDHLKIIKATIRKAEDFYRESRLPDSILVELIEDFYSMEMAKIKDDQWEYFFYLYKQIESIVNYCLVEKIGLKRIKEDIDNNVLNPSNGWDSVKCERVSNTLESINGSISFGYTLDLFYVYYVKSIDTKSRLEELNFYKSNKISKARNFYAHGGKMNDQTDKALKEIETEHELNIYSFYQSYDIFHRQFINYVRSTHEFLSKIKGGIEGVNIPSQAGLILK